MKALVILIVLVASQAFANDQVLRFQGVVQFEIPQKPCGVELRYNEFGKFISASYTGDYVSVSLPLLSRVAMRAAYHVSVGIALPFVVRDGVTLKDVHNIGVKSASFFQANADASRETGSFAKNVEDAVFENMNTKDIPFYRGYNYMEDSFFIMSGYGVPKASVTLRYDEGSPNIQSVEFSGSEEATCDNLQQIE